MIYVKICGLTNFEDARVAVEAGADLLGFIFYPPSPRYVRPETVREIVTRLKESTRSHSSLLMPHFIGVFVNEALEKVQSTLDFCGLDAAQLHGDEPPDFVAALAGRAYKALRPKSKEEFEQALNNYQFTVHHSSLPALLLDAYHPTLFGGTGHVADWTLAAAVARQHPVLLAGSLTPDNVALAVREVEPWGVDVSSGVEAAPGRKDHARVRAFVANARSVNPNK